MERLHKYVLNDLLYFVHKDKIYRARVQEIKTQIRDEWYNVQYVFKIFEDEYFMITKYENEVCDRLNGLPVDVQP